MAASTTASTVPLVAGQLSGAEKRKDIQDILSVLEVDFEKKRIPPQECNEILERLRIHATSLNDLNPLLTKRGISILCRYGFDITPLTTNRIALRCLCNVLFLAEPMRQIFVNEDYIKKMVERMKNGNADDELLSARLLFLCTYGTKLNFDPLLEKYDIAETININISRNVKLITSAEGHSLPSPATISACGESLKLLYNLMARYPHQVPLFSRSLLPILKMLNKIPIPSPPLQPPMSLLINSLVLINLEDKNVKDSTGNLLFPHFDSNINVDRLTHILDLAARAYKDEEIDSYGSPLVQVLFRIAKCAPPEPKAHLKTLLLPSNQDRNVVLGRGDSLPSILLRLSAAPMAPHLRELVPTLLFELSDNDAKKFVHNVGYGFASGFLFSQGLQPPSSVLEKWGSTDVNHNNTSRGRERGRVEEIEIDSDTEGANKKEGVENYEVNPITGQRRDMEPRVPTPEMTDEEKEREAERLFVLFERLRATGVVNVENPVARAVREGRFEEVD